MNTALRRVAIIGAGITGLTAAFRLQTAARKRALALETTVFEANVHPGGKLQTQRHGPFLVEAGPDSFYAQKPALTGLIHALGLDAQRVPGTIGQAYVRTRDGLFAIPRGMILGVPTQFMPFFGSPLFSPLGKLRILLEPLCRRAVPEADESVEAFFRRAFGNELVTRLITPLFSAIYAEDARYLSARVAVPRLHALQEKHRSLILALRDGHAHRLAAAGFGSPPPKAAPFATFIGGMQTFTDALAARQPACAIVCNTGVRHIHRSEGRLRLISRAGDPFDADAVIIATPSRTAARLLGMEAAFAALHTRPPASVATVALGLPAVPPNRFMRGTGFIATRGVARHVTACTWSHLKWPHCAPRGHALLRCHVGGPGREDIVAADDETILQSVLRDLKTTVALDARPDFHAITRWPDAMPRYAVGHLQHVTQVREAVARRFPEVQIAGAAYGGPGLSACVGDGEQAANATLDYLFGPAPRTCPPSGHGAPASGTVRPAPEAALST